MNDNSLKKGFTAAVVLNGEKYNGQIIGDIIVAVDGGYDKTERADIFIGDRDSVASNVTCVDNILLNVDKDETDGEYAVKYVISKGAKQINFYGLAGGRFDHILTNLSLMAICLKNGVKATAYCNDCDIYMVSDSLNLNLNKNTIVSLVPFTDSVHIISLEGVKWQIFDENICKDSTRTISNVANGDEIRLCVDNGIVLVVVNK